MALKQPLAACLVLVVGAFIAGPAGGQGQPQIRFPGAGQAEPAGTPSAGDVASWSAPPPPPARSSRDSMADRLNRAELRRILGGRRWPRGAPFR